MWAYSRIRASLNVDWVWLRVTRARLYSTAFYGHERRTWAQKTLYRANGTPRSKTMGFITASSTALAIYYAQHRTRTRRELREFKETKRKFMVIYLSGVQISRRAAEDKALPALYERFGRVTNETLAECMRSLHALYRLPDPDLHLRVSVAYRVMHVLMRKLFDQRDRPITMSKEFVADYYATMHRFVDNIVPYCMVITLLMEEHAREREQQSSEKALSEPSENE